ncbi:MAG TPA: enoyl-CoA hydratase-related protein, partial [Acidimicrobiales bacterium]|nr:enoyl-CoA hydratase-related protein [Acidimicrobiales bacterium]
AARAKEIGLAWKVVPDGQLMDEARTLAVRLTRGAPLAQRAIKEMASRGRELPWIDAVRFGETMRKVAGATEDATEGLSAAAERRDPHWKGR